jgi:hypothetical protein
VKLLRSSMKPVQIFLVLALLAATCPALGASPGNAPQLPIAGTRIVNVATEPQLQNAMGNLQHGDTLLLADGTYNLTSSLYINGRHNITIRGTNGSTNVVLAGKGMDNSNHGGVPFGIWSNGTNTTIAHLTIRDTWDNEIIFNPGAQSPRTLLRSPGERRVAVHQIQSDRRQRGAWSEQRRGRALHLRVHGQSSR